MTEANRLQLVFDTKVDPRLMQVEYFKDTVQITFQDAAVYPPKISAVNSPFLTKTFAYQYSPSTVRFRMTVKGLAEDYKDRVAVKSNGKILSIEFSKPLMTAQKLDGDIDTELLSRVKSGVVSNMAAASKDENETVQAKPEANAVK